MRGECTMSYSNYQSAHGQNLGCIDEIVPPWMKIVPKSLLIFDERSAMGMIFLSWNPLCRSVCSNVRNHGTVLSCFFWKGWVTGESFWNWDSRESLWVLAATPALQICIRSWRELDMAEDASYYVVAVIENRAKEVTKKNPSNLVN